MDQRHVSVTLLLEAWAAGNAAAEAPLFEAVYPELRRLARQYLAREQRRITLQATDLVHDTYLKLVDQRQDDWRCRAHFFAVAATLVRRILLDHAKHRQRHKRGRGAVHVSVDDVQLPGLGPDLDFLEVDRALVELAGIQMSAARLVELRFFAGLTFDEAAEVMGLSRSTVLRKWRFAKAWLARKLGGNG